jgi:hypothetical protein
MDAICRYLHLHPDAADSEEGIMNWWLQEMGVTSHPAELQRALLLLLRRGALSATPLPDGRSLYRAPQPTLH